MTKEEEAANIGPDFSTLQFRVRTSSRTDLPRIQTIASLQLNTMRITPPIIDYRNVSKVEAVFYNLDFKSSDDSISIPESATSHPHIDRGSIFEITLSDIDPEVDYSQYEISHGIELSRWEAQSKREDLQEKRYTSIENHVLADWLRNTQPNDQPVSSDDTSSVMPIPLAGLRLAFCHLQPRFISAEPRGGSRKGKGRDIGTDLSDAMGVPEELRFLQKGEFCFGKVSPSRLELGPDETEAATKTDPIFICKLSSNSYFRDLIFSYNPETNVTTGYVLLKSGNELDMVGLMRKLETGFFSCPSPLMVPITIIELVADTCRSQMAALHTEFTTSIEEQTGFGAYASRREEGVREKLIYDQLAIRQGELQGRAVLLQTVISGFLSMAEFVSKELQTLEELDENGQDHYYERVYDSRLQEWLQQRVRVTQSFLSSLAGYAGLKERMDIQQTVVSSIF